MIRLADYQMSGSPESGTKITRFWHVDSEAEIGECITQNQSYNGFISLREPTARAWSPDTIEAGFEVSITFGTIDTTFPDDDQEYGGDRAKWGFEPSFQQTAIEKHPEINFLIDNYGGEEDPQTHRVTFKRFLPELPREGARGLLGKNYKDDKGNIKNPAYGFNESGFITLGGVAQAAYTTAHLSTAMRGVGKVFRQLPGNAPDYGVEDDRNWIKMPPSINEVAREEDGRRWYEMRHQFMLSDVGGWPPGVYKFIEV